MMGWRIGWGAQRQEAGDQLVSSCLVPDQSWVRVGKGEGWPRDAGGMRQKLDGRLGEAGEKGCSRVRGRFPLGVAVMP